MATPHTLDMATPGMARVCLHGDLQRFGRRFSLSIKTGAEAIYALAMQIPGFRQKMNDGWYQIRIAGQDVDETSASARLHEPLPDGAIIHIVPRMAGAKSGGLFQAVLGAVAIGAAFFTGGASLAAWGAFSTGLFTAGVGMMLGGVAQMLAPQAKVPSSRQTDNGKQNTYFSSLDNMVAQGNALPVLYGEMLVGSRTISQEISTRDEGGGGQVVIIGR
ncbi:tail assembly protein [Salmonella enterica]|nr:tail assembly protein [Salmonella enterica]